MRLQISPICIGAIALAHSATAETPFADKFDLICTGTVVTANIGATDFASGFVIPSPTDYSMHLRVDLSSSTFCADDCPKAEAIVLVRPDVVVFRSNEGAFGVGQDELTVSRATGSFVHQWNITGNRDRGVPFLGKRAIGSCVRAPYTPIPATVF